MRKGKAIRPVAAGVLAVALAGCGSLPDAGGSGASSSDAAAAVVQQRAEARWALVLKGDNVAAYQYLSPGSKAAFPLEQYILQAPRHFRAATVTGVQCGSDRCDVKLDVTYDSKLVKGVTTPLREIWLLDGGQWWYVHRV